MSIRSLTDFMEVSLRSARRLASTATVTGRRGPQVDASVRGADFWWPKLRTFGGHQCGPLMAISADFLVAMDRWARSVPATQRTGQTKGTPKGDQYSRESPCAAGSSMTQPTPADWLHTHSFLISSS